MVFPRGSSRQAPRGSIGPESIEASVAALLSALPGPWRSHQYCHVAVETKV